MRIAFLGKGGSGKTTLSSLFSLYADSKGYRVGLLDVDVNSHTAEVVGADASVELSQATTQAAIQAYLSEHNPRVHAHEMLNTTPPGEGSQYWTFDDDNYLSQYGGRFGDMSRVFNLGSYKSSEIGHGCHHGTQYVAENMISHIKLAEKDILVIDSVAGNDSFANSLYFQDLLLFIVKPEREGVAVFQRYYELARQAGVADRVRVIANQVISPKQSAFLQRELPEGVLLGELPVDDDVIEARLDDAPLTAAHVSRQAAMLFDEVLKLAATLRRSPQEYYDFYCQLHQKVSSESWVHGAYRAGLEDQIDPEYQA